MHFRKITAALCAVLSVTLASAAAASPKVAVSDHKFMVNGKDGSFTIVYLSDGSTPHQLELTWLRDWDKPYNLGDNEFHLALSVDDFGAAHHRHQQMGCICFENPAMGIYFISDPDGYWVEIIPSKM